MLPDWLSFGTVLPQAPILVGPEPRKPEVSRSSILGNPCFPPGRGENSNLGGAALEN
jgi:hypothetical protein